MTNQIVLYEEITSFAIKSQLLWPMTMTAHGLKFLFENMMMLSQSNDDAKTLSVSKKSRCSLNVCLFLDWILFIQ